MLHRMRSLAASLTLAAVGIAGCRTADARRPLSSHQRAAIADTLERLIVSAYDLSKPDVERRLMSLYPDTGRVVSATAGQITTSRDSLASGLHTFWVNVGSRMQQPHWTWGPMYVDVLSPSAAVLTTSYVVPHRTPAGEPHVIAGAWTAIFERRGGRWMIVQEHLSDLPPQLAARLAPAADSSSMAGMRH